MKVAISFIGTNRYLDYLPQYYENIEKYFLPNSEKTILAFTDGELNDTPDNVKVYHQEHLHRFLNRRVQQFQLWRVSKFLLR